jgi:hypothetical protein
MAFALVIGTCESPRDTYVLPSCYPAGTIHTLDYAGAIDLQTPHLLEHREKFLRRMHKVRVIFNPPKHQKEEATDSFDSK